MTRYVKNPAGSVQSVPDDFEVPAEWGDDWDEVSESEARTTAPALFGATDPAVQAAEIHHRGLRADGSPISVPVYTPNGGDAA